MIRWSAFADLEFGDSARLAFVRAVEAADTDAHEHHPAAWVIDDRRITLSMSVETPVSVLDGTRRLLGALVLDATAGEAVIEVPELGERWARKAELPLVSVEISVADDEPVTQTIRTEAC